MKSIISTKNTQKHVLAKSVIIGIIVFIVFISLCCVGIYMMPSSNSSSGELGPMTLTAALCGIMAIVIPAVLIFPSIKYSKTYVEINQEIFSGEGMEMINGTREGGVVYFNILFSELKKVVVKSGWVTLYTDKVTYKILTDKNTAIEILNIYNNINSYIHTKGLYL